MRECHLHVFEKGDQILVCKAWLLAEVIWYYNNWDSPLKIYTLKELFSTRLLAVNPLLEFVVALISADFLVSSMHGAVLQNSDSVIFFFVREVLDWARTVMSSMRAPFYASPSPHMGVGMGCNKNRNCLRTISLRWEDMMTLISVEGNGDRAYTHFVERITRVFYWGVLPVKNPFWFPKSTSECLRTKRTQHF